MNMNLDEIYNLFIWDESYSEEEYVSRESRGIAEASKLKNIYPFIRPVIIPPEKSKSVWDSCAKAVALKSDDELTPYLYLLLEWLRDMNWPGAEIIFDRLGKIPFSKIVQQVEFCIGCAKRENDRSWMDTLEALKEHRQWH